MMSLSADHPKVPHISATVSSHPETILQTYFVFASLYFLSHPLSSHYWCFQVKTVFTVFVSSNYFPTNRFLVVFELLRRRHLPTRRLIRPTRRHSNKISLQKHFKRGGVERGRASSWILCCCCFAHTHPASLSWVYIYIYLYPSFILHLFGRRSVKVLLTSGVAGVQT